MSKSVAKISVERLLGNRGFQVHEDDSAFATLTYMSDKSIEYRYEASAATLCFIRGKGRISIEGSQIEYGGKWFDIPRFVEYQILPETDTLMLTILKPTSEEDPDSFGGNVHDTHIVS